jgi:hypothetical protein
MQQIEPQYLTCAIYDLKERRRVTENFSVDVNDYDARQMVKRPTPGSSTSGTRAIFHLVKPAPEMYLVIRVEKTLMGDMETATEPYYKVGVCRLHRACFRLCNRCVDVVSCCNSAMHHRSNPKSKRNSRACVRMHAIVWVNSVNRLVWLLCSCSTSEVTESIPKFVKPSQSTS